MEWILLRLSAKSFITQIIILASLLFLVASDCLGSDFTTKKRKAVEQDNNVLATKGYIVENLLYRDKSLGPLALMTYATDGKLYIMNNQGKIFLNEPTKNNLWVPSGLSCPATAIDIAVNKDGNIIVLEKNSVFKLTKNGKKSSVVKLPDKINPARLAANKKDEVYLVDDSTHIVYFLAKGAKAFVQKKFDFLVLDISFDEQDNMYVLDGQRKIRVLGSNAKDSRATFDIPKNKNPDKIAANRNGSQIYLLDTKSRDLYAVTKYGIFRNVAFFSSYHSPLSKPVIGNDDTVFVLTGQSPQTARIIRIGIDKFPHRPYAIAFELLDYSCDAIAFDKDANLYFGNGKKIVEVKNNSSEQEVVLEERNGLRDPEGIAFDGSGNCYISDDAAIKVFKIDKSKKEVLVYADESKGLEEPQALVFDKAGNAFIGDEKARTIFKIAPNGSVSKFITAKDGLQGLEDITIDSSDFIYVAQENDDKIFKISPQGKVNVFADARKGLIGPGAVAIDSKGYVYVSDEETSTVYKFSPGADLQSCIKINTNALRHLGGIAVSPTGKVYVCSKQADTSVIYVVNFDLPLKRDSLVSRGFYAMHRLCGLKEGLFMPSGLAFDKGAKTLYIGTPGMLFKFQNNKIMPVCKIDYCGFRDLALDKNSDIIATAGGLGKVYLIGKDLSINILATKDEGLMNPEGITLDDQGRLYIADEQARKIFVLEDKKIKSVKGLKLSPEKIFYHDSYFYVTEDGPARFSKVQIDPDADFDATSISECRFPYCEGIAIDGDQNFYLSSDGYSEIYKFKQLNGNKDIIADWQDGLIGPESLVTDNEGNLYVADQEAHAVFKINKIKSESPK